MCTYHQDNLKEYCTYWGTKPTPTDILCAKLMDAGLEIYWRPGFDFKIIRKATGCEGRLALHFRSGRRYRDCHWKFDRRSGEGVDLMLPVKELIKAEKLVITKERCDDYIWVHV